MTTMCLILLPCPASANETAWDPAYVAGIGVPEQPTATATASTRHNEANDLNTSSQLRGLDASPSARVPNACFVDNRGYESSRNTTFPPTIVARMRRGSVRPANGVTWPFDANCCGSTRQGR